MRSLPLFAILLACGLSASAQTPQAPAPPRDSPVPGWVHRVLGRGLSVDPGARFPLSQKVQVSRQYF